MRHLRSHRDHTVVILRSSDDESSELELSEHILDDIDLAENGIAVLGRIRYEDHGCSHEHVRLGIIVTGILSAGHRVSAYEGEPVFVSETVSFFADVSLKSADIRYDRVCTNEGSILFQISDCRLGVERDDQKIHASDAVPVQNAVDRSLFHRLVQRGSGAVVGEDGNFLAALLEAFCKRSSDKT